MKIVQGKSKIIMFTTRVKRVAVANPKIIQAAAVTPREVVLNAKNIGTTTVLIWDIGGALYTFDITVHIDSEVVQEVLSKLRNVLPVEDLSVSQAGNSLVVSGTVSTEEAKKKALKVVNAFAFKKVVDNIKVDEIPPQVLLKVHFAEISRSGAINIGLAFIRQISQGKGQYHAGFFPGAPGFTPTGPFLPPITGLPGPDLTFTGAIDFFIGRSDRSKGFFLRALKDNGYIRTLAEPHLRVVSGKKATFLVGGEAPIPVPGQDGQVTIMFKPFGIKLEFTPKVKPSGMVELKVKPEVSSIDEAISVVVSGFNVPGFKTSNADTQVELRDGQTMAISGLLSEETKRNLARIPYIGDVPILGELFKSRDFKDKKTELVILVTPTVIRPSKVARLVLRRSGFMLGRLPRPLPSRRSAGGNR